MGNSDIIYGRLRNGLYDYLFETVTRNRPVAFDLADSPFGAEPLDVFDDFPGMSTYKEHYDGYMFLLPLDKEPGRYFLPELFTDDFIKELKRRSRISNYPEGWYEMPAETLSKEQIIQKLEADQRAPRWVFPID